MKIVISAAFITAGLLITSISTANETKFHRTSAENLQPDGWHLARSTYGNYTVKLPCRFNDATIVTEKQRGYVLGCTDGKKTVYNADLTPRGSGAGVYEQFEKDVQVDGSTFKGYPAVVKRRSVGGSEISSLRVKTPEGIYVLMAVYTVDNRADADTFLQSLEFAASAPASEKK